jgi:hypothetical protein
MSDPTPLPSVLANPYASGCARARVLDGASASDLGERLDAAQSTGTPVVALPSFAELDARLVVAVTGANDDYFRFDLTHLHEAPWPRVLDLPDLSGEDLVVGGQHPTRKLTVVLPLGPEGTTGEVVLAPHGKVEAAEAGVALVFPSYLVPAVAKGPSMPTLVTFAHGPSFR